MSSPARKTILVVDDDVELRTILRLALEDDGFNFDSAGNGLAALQKVRERTPDLVILDLNMPRMGGEQFLYAWRAGVEMTGVPVIVITATSDALRPTDLGVEAVFPKPFDVERLLGCISDLLSLPTLAPVAAQESQPTRELRGIVEDLTQVTSVVLVTAEQLADAPNLPDEVRRLTSTGMDAAHRASVLVRRLAHLIGTLE
jgi:DNA-binding response OmpR family regulator